MYVIRNRSGAHYSRITYIIRNAPSLRSVSFRIMPVPADITAHFILIEAQVFGGFQVLFNAPAGATGLHHSGEWRGKGSPDQVIGQLVRVVEAATYHQPVSSLV